MGGSSKKQTVGYKYSLGAHMGICHGPIDNITRIRVSDRIAWEGESTGGAIFVDNEDLFGGPEREGGIYGAVDFEFGAIDQTVNTYLNSVQPVASETIPAYRGICSAVLNQVYLGTNPYLKPWEFRAQRIHTSTRGALQWYDEKAEVPGETGEFTSSWDFSLISYNSESSPDIRLDSRDVWVSDDESKVFSITPFPDSSMYSWEMTTPGDLSTLTLIGSKSGVGFDPSGVFVKPDGLSAFVFSKTSAGFRTFSMATAFDSSTATLVGNFGGIGPGSYGCHFRGDGLYFYNCLGTTIQQWLLSVPWAPHAGMTHVHSFSMSGVTSSTLFGISGSAEGDKLYVTNTSGGDHGWQLSISDVDDISTAIIINVLNPAISIANSFHIISSGEKLYASNQGSDVIKKYNFTGYFESGDMNPAHIIRECITDNNWGMGYTSSDIDDTSFMSAADTLFNEVFGMSLLWSQDDKIEEFIQDVLRHIDGLLYINPRTGKFTLKLIRDDYVVASLPILDESNIISINDYEKPTIGELTNYVTVKYWDRSTSQNASISVQDIALAQQQGSVVPAAVTFTGITNGALASRVASRTLQALSNPIIACSIIADRNASSLNIGDAFKLSWAKFGLTETIMRVTNISFGTLTNGQVKIDCIQDVFALPQATFSSPTDSGFTTPTNAPANSPYRLVEEVNYWTLIQDQGEDFTFNELDGWLLTAAVRPSSDALNYRVWTDESGAYQEKESADFCPTATITDDFPKATSGVINVTVGLSGLDADDIADIDIGSPCQIGNEIMSVVSLTTTEGTFGRSVIDSPIEDHLSGDRIFFWGNSFYGGSAELYQDSDTIGVKITPSTAQGQLDVADATAESLTFDQRAYRAWLPGNVKINSVYFPTYIENTSTVDSTWAHRDRTLQTAGLVDFDEVSIGPEGGTTYTTTLIRVNNSVVLDTNSGLTGTTDSLDTAGYDGLVRYEIKSIRDSLDSYFTHTHELPVTRTSFILTEQGDFILTEDGEYLVTES